MSYNKLLLGAALVTVAYGSSIIYSHRVTDYGGWGSWSNCSKGYYAKGVKTKWEGRQGERFGHNDDDTALNAIEFLCVKLGQGHNEDMKIKSKEGGWGNWGSPHYCDGFITGFSLRSESSQGGDDDTAANNIKVKCSDGKEIISGGMHYGEWREWVNCPKGHVVDGLRTQVEDSQGDRTDDTALNNVDMRCSQIDDQCTPEDKWEQILRSVGITIGTSSSNGGNTESWSETSIGAEVGATIKTVVTAKFTATQTWRSTTGHNWQNSDSKDYTTATTVTLRSSPVPKGHVLRIYQVKGKCGEGVTIGTSNYRSKIEEVTVDNQTPKVQH